MEPHSRVAQFWMGELPHFVPDTVSKLSAMATYFFRFQKSLQHDLNKAANTGLKPSVVTLPKHNGHDMLGGVKHGPRSLL